MSSFLCTSHFSQLHKNGNNKRRRSGWDQITPSGRSVNPFWTPFGITLFSPEKEQEQTGRLITPATLPVLNADQLQALQLAKRYCQDISNKFVSPFNTPLTAIF